MIGPQCCSGGLQGEGNPDYGVMIIGIAPGRDEAQVTHRPFTGPAGDIMNKLLAACGWSREQCYCTNSICWWNDAPTPSELAVCWPRLQKEIELVKPKLIIALGTIVCQHLLSNKLGKLRGIPCWSNAFNCYVMPVNHPAAILNSQNDKPALAQDFLCTLVRDFKKIPSFINELAADANPSTQVIDYEIITEPSEAQAVLDGLPKDRIVTLDIETEQKESEQIDAFVYDLSCLSIYDGSTAYVFSRDACEGLNWPKDVRWTFHNGLFDTAGLHRYLGVDLPIVEDTMLMSYSLDERGGYHGLKNLAREYCWAPFWEEGKDEDLYKYNALDAYYTYKLWHVLKDQQLEDDVRGMYTDLLIPAFNMLRDTHVKGVPISRKEMNKLAGEWIPKALIQEQQLIQLAQQLGYPGKINLNSSQQLGTMLFGILGLESKKLTKGGRPSVDAEVLDSLDHPFVTALHEQRTLMHMLKSYILGINDDIKYDKLLHPLPKIHGAVTGRLSYSAPPVQTIPQDYTVGELAVLRRMFAAQLDGDDEDYVIMESDYSQIEIWMGMGFSHDPQMLDDLTEPWEPGSGPNYHSRIARDVLRGDTTASKDVWGAFRNRAKRVTFGIMYLIGASLLANSRTGIGCTTREANDFIRRWYQRNAAFEKWQQSTIKEGHENGELVTPFGRKRRIHAAVNPRVDPLLANFKIQSTASDYTLTSAIKLNRLLAEFDSRILFLVHDSIVMRVKRQYLEEVATLVWTVMTELKLPGMPRVPVEMKVGPNWFDVKEYKINDYVSSFDSLQQWNRQLVA